MAKHIIGSEIVVSLIPWLVTNKINIMLLVSLLNDKVKKTVFNVGGTKAPSPNGFLGLLYQSNLDLFGFDLYNMVHRFYS